MSRILFNNITEINSQVIKKLVADSQKRRDEMRDEIGRLKVALGQAPEAVR